MFSVFPVSHFKKVDHLEIGNSVGPADVPLESQRAGDEGRNKCKASLCCIVRTCGRGEARKEKGRREEENEEHRVKKGGKDVRKDMTSSLWLLLVLCEYTSNGL